MDISSISAKVTYTPATSANIKAADPLKEMETQQQLQAAATTDSYEKSGSTEPASSSTASSDTAATDIAAAQSNNASTASTESASTDTATTETAVLESLEESSATSKYTAAEIAQYDTDGDGEIDAGEELAMKLAQAQDQLESGLSVADFDKARAAYETAMQQGVALAASPIQ